MINDGLLSFAGVLENCILFYRLCQGYKNNNTRLLSYSLNKLI